MKSGLTVVAVLLLISGVVAFWLSRRYGPELTQTQDVITGLIYFMEDHDARFPASEDEFRAAPFIEQTADGLRVLPKSGTKFRRETHGILIRDLKPFTAARMASFPSMRPRAKSNTASSVKVAMKVSRSL